jgi:hypothetical protein
MAALIIQMTMRRYLSHIMKIKHHAAFIIQRNWRKASFIWKALLRTISFSKPTDHQV